jgi:hypothetical protein
MNANIHHVVSIKATPVALNTLPDGQVYAVRHLEVVNSKGHTITLNLFSMGDEESVMQEKLRIQQ